MTYCRVYLNHQTAAAHQLAFQQIEAIVEQDTGESLKWRHLSCQLTKRAAWYLAMGG